MLSIYVSKFVVQQGDITCFSTSAFVAKTQEDAERKATYATIKKYPQGSIRLLESIRIDDDLIDMAYMSRN